MMVYAVMESAEEYFPQGILFESESDFAKAVVDPVTVSATSILRFCVRGEDYEDRKENLRQLAINFSNADQSNIGLYDTAKIEAFFRKEGKRYGLLREFKENAIC